MSTKIEWADMTINPVVGCSHCSPGCDHCYAERFAARMAKHPKTAKKYSGVVDEKGKWTGVIDFDVSCLVKLPRKPKRIFVGSMCDLFHDSVMDNHLEQIMGHLGLTRDNAHHTFMLLTKRPERMRDFFTRWEPYRKVTNVWLGVTVCNQAEADEKIPVLLQTPAAVRFVSVEPCLGPVDLGHLSWTDIIGSTAEKNALTGKTWIQGNCGESSQTLQGNRLDWVICGGETGPGARPMHPDWVRSLRDQCQSAGVPFFFKGWGEWAPIGWVHADSKFDLPHIVISQDGRVVQSRKDLAPSHNSELRRVGKRRAGRLLDGRTCDEFPEGGRAYAN